MNATLCNICFIIFFYSCSVKSKITSKSIHHPIGYSENITIHKLKVDSLNKEGVPLRYHYDSVQYTAEHLWNWDYTSIQQYIKPKYSNDYATNLKIYDSIKKFGGKEFRKEDTISFFGIKYLPMGDKFPIAYYWAEEFLEHYKFLSVTRGLSKKVHFTKRNKYYRWIIKKDTQSRIVPTIDFLPNNWYSVRLLCPIYKIDKNYCNYFFYVNEKKEIKTFRMDD